MKPKPIEEVKARIQQHRRVGVDYFRLRLLCPEIARLAQPGQFVMLRVSDSSDPLLRRPFSFFRIFPPRTKKRKRPEDEGALEICYQVVGRGTSRMTQLREGERLDVLGPLGKGFWPEEGRSLAILIGGGIGVAPLVAWAEQLRREQGKKKRFSKTSGNLKEVLVLIGGKSRDKIPGIREFMRMGLEPQIATEDGSLGFQGLATDLLERELVTQGHKSAALYSCGPLPMLARVAQITDQFDLPCQVLLESRMACGVGACLGCAVKVRDRTLRGALEDEDARAQGAAVHLEDRCGEEMAGSWREGLAPIIAEPPAFFRYVRACKEGPVFEARDILWE